MGDKGRMGPKGPPYPDHDELLRYWQWNDDEVDVLQSEIERLRKALQSICNCSTKMDYRKTSNRLDDIYRIARAALGEKE